MYGGEKIKELRICWYLRTLVEVRKLLHYRESGMIGTPSCYILKRSVYIVIKKCMKVRISLLLHESEIPTRYISFLKIFHQNSLSIKSDTFPKICTAVDVEQIRPGRIFM